MRVIKKSEGEENHNWACRIDLDFFVRLFVMQNRDFRVSEGPFLGQKTKTSVSRRYVKKKADRYQKPFLSNQIFKSGLVL